MKPTLALLLAPLTALAAVAPQPVDFSREIRPLLSDQCFTCHGFDAQKRKAGLRLDTKEGAFGKGESGETAIVPGDPAKSELMLRIRSTDPDEMMPPAKDHKRLSAAQVALIERWIKEGATYTGHWAFQQVKEPALPAVAGAGWVKTPPDRFVLARLEREKLAPSPEEDRARWLRRVTLDLTGLPPTPAEVDAFVADKNDGAHERVVDRLLAAPQFGERLAVPWLDLARFADTGGYHNDSLRQMWLFREWVVGAFNRNLPFDQFTIEQLAGDLLPNSTTEQKIASGFHRNVMTSDEGGLIDEEYLNLYQVDRVSTTGTTWLGLTVACAQCHDHKYDPISARDFYSLYAFFHNVPEKAKDGIRNGNPAPIMQVPSAEQKAEQKKFADEIAAADKEIAAMNKQVAARQAEWEKTAATTPLTLPVGASAHFPLDADGALLTDSGARVENAVKGTATFVEGEVGQSFRVEGQGWIEVGERFGFEKDQPFSAAAWLRLKGKGGSPFGKMGGPGVAGWDIEFKGSKPSVHLIHQWPGNALHIEAEKDLPVDEFLHLAFTYDGSGKASGLRLFLNGSQLKTKIVKDTLSGSIKTAEPFSIGRRGSKEAPFTGRVDDLRIYARTLAVGEIAALGGASKLAIAAIEKSKRTPEQQKQLDKFFRDTQVPELAELTARREKIAAAQKALEKEIPNTMVMDEMSKARPTFIKVRGAYDQNGEQVQPVGPAFLPPIPPRADGKPLNRLDLARWLVSREHPLTARVTVNRWWAMLFGNGIVKTVNDFGAQSEWPSHPELLDWLAADFMRDWDVKRAVRQMVLSATYRQSARVTPALLERDSDNRLLARGPRQRLDAEFIRDNALAIAGLLDRRLGGPSVKPQQPPGIWEINDMSNDKWVQSTGADIYRRGLYVYWRRSSPYPSMIAFDAPSREVCLAARARTSTPLQSLVLLNDPVYVEAARAFAQRILADGGPDDAARLAFAWRTTLGRPLAETERAILEKTLSTLRADFSQDETAAAALLKVGPSPPPENAAAKELAPWIMLANALLNLGETTHN